MPSFQTTKLDLPNFYYNNLEDHVLTQLNSASFLYIRYFFDNDCITFSNKNKVYIVHQHKLPLQDHRNTSNGVWMIPVPITLNTSRTKSNTSTTPQKILHHTNNNIYEINLIKDQSKYLNSICSSPSKLTFIKVIKAGYVTILPNLRAKLVSKYLQKYITSADGYLDQRHKNVNLPPLQQ